MHGISIDLLHMYIRTYNVSAKQFYVLKRQAGRYHLYHGADWNTDGYRVLLTT